MRALAGVVCVIGLSGCGAVDTAKGVVDQQATREGTKKYADYSSLSREMDVVALSEGEWATTASNLCDNSDADFRALVNLLMVLSNGGNSFYTDVKEKAINVYVSCPEKGKDLDAALHAVSKGAYTGSIVSTVRLADAAGSLK